VSQLLNQINGRLLNEPVTDQGETFLYIATRAGNRDAVRVLLDRGAVRSINQPDSDMSLTPFQNAVLEGDVDMVNMLYDAAKDYGIERECIATRDQTQANLLHYAVQSQQVPMVQWVLANGGNAFINEPDGNLFSPLMSAIGSRNAAIVRLLLDHGARVNNYALGYALQQSNPMDQETYQRNNNLVQLARHYMAMSTDRRHEALQAASDDVRDFIFGMENMSQAEQLDLINDLEISAPQPMGRGSMSEILHLLMSRADANVRSNAINAFRHFSQDPLFRQDFDQE
jgi:ankyrin repeat protein